MRWRLAFVTVLVLLAGCTTTDVSETVTPMTVDRPTVTTPTVGADDLRAINGYGTDLTVRLLVIEAGTNVTAEYENGTTTTYPIDYPGPGRFLAGDLEPGMVDIRAESAAYSVRREVPSDGAAIFRDTFERAPEDAAVIAAVGGGGSGYSLYATQCREGYRPVSGTLNVSAGRSDLECRRVTDQFDEHEVDLGVYSRVEADTSVGVYLLDAEPTTLSVAFANGTERSVPLDALPIPGWNVTRVRPAGTPRDGVWRSVRADGRTNVTLRTRLGQPEILAVGVAPKPDGTLRVTGESTHCRIGQYTAGGTVSISEYGIEPDGLVCSAGTPAPVAR